MGTKVVQMQGKGQKGQNGSGSNQNAKLGNQIVGNPIPKSVQNGLPARLIPGTLGNVTGGSSKKLGENIFKSIGCPANSKRAPYQAQHIIPSELKSHPVIKKIGMDFDNASNGIFLKNRKIGDVSTMARHQGRHPAYTDFIESKLNELDITQPVPVLEREVYNIQQKAKKMLERGIPIYACDNEGPIYQEKQNGSKAPLIPKMEEDYNKRTKYVSGEATVDLLERWYSKI